MELDHDYDLMNTLFHNGYWIEILQSTQSDFHFPTLSDLNLPAPCYLPESSSSSENNNNNNSSSTLTLSNMDEFVGSEAAFTVEETDMRKTKKKRLWMAPTVNPSPDISVKKRLIQAIEYLRESTKNRDVLIQIWVPVTRNGEQVLTTNNQPFSVNPSFKSLSDYRDASRNYHFAAEENNSKQSLGLPGRVFLKKLPEWTPDVRYLKIEEYHRLYHARQFNVSGSIALPVFQRGTGNCLGVVEIVTTSMQTNFHPEIENVCRALEAVDLRSSKILGPPRVQAWHEHYEAVLLEIQQVLRAVCDTHNLPLAQAWAPCIQQGKGGRRHSDENYTYCVSTIDSACYVPDPRFSIFHKACSEHHLFKGQGIAGKAFTTNQPCFSDDITSFSDTEYPLAQHARRCGLLRAAVAICLRSIHTGSADFVLEFFLPSSCIDEDEQKLMLTSLSSVVQNECRTLRVVMDEELAEEIVINHHQMEETPSITTTTTTSSSWIAEMMEAQGNGKGVSISLGPYHHDQKEDEMKQEFKITTTEWESGDAEDLQAFNQNNSFKRRKKTEKTISLQVLRQYFAGSLKDAAKCIGVCPTTLKRICRQHGITRWPSRKIKKVGHSLQKLQLVMDSVNPGGGSTAIQIGSFYDSFPELGCNSDEQQQQQQQQEQHQQQQQRSSSNSATASVTVNNVGCSSSSSLAEVQIQTTVPPPPDPDPDPHLSPPARPELEGNREQIPTVGVKARYKEDNIRFSMQEKWGYEDLMGEIGKRFKVEDVSRMGLKYLDDDSEWVLLTCDDDLEECLDIHKSSSKTARTTIKLSVHDQPPFTGN
ncbi:protein NLP4-like [Impatiens glandulifera]|uniref:protein NLP4-like n=1 Tax=Impatiens glandulifera TaxID=253017 RepID=UPI001FB0562E|nr:protein NLP4-like [Impatiens glandulifera]